MKSYFSTTKQSLNKLLQGFIKLKQRLIKLKQDKDE